MTITSVSSVINATFLQRIGAATSGSSSTSSLTGGANAASITLSGLSNGARVFTNALSGLNSLISFVNITRADLEDFKEITTEMVSVVTKATKGGIGQSTRAALNGEFEDLAIEFRKKVSKLTGRDYDGTQKTELEEVFSLLGFDKASSKSFADLVEQFSFFDNEKGAEVLNSDLSQALRPIRIPQSALQATVRNVYANGNGSFYGRTSATLSGGASVTSSATGDADNDLVDEVAFLDANGVAYVSVKDADGTFRTTTSVALVTDPGTKSALQFKDMNGDGRDDLIAMNSFESDAYSYIALANADGSFAASISTLIYDNVADSGDPAIAYEIADYDEDGINDIVFQNSLLVQQVLKGVGDGTFGASLATLNAYSGTGVNTFQSADVNGDGNVDIVSMHNQGFTVTLGNGDGTFAEGVSYTQVSDKSTIQKFVLSDVDENGSADIVFSDTTSNALRVWVNDGLGTYSAGAVISNTGASHSVFSSDINNDGFEDLVSLDSSGSTVYSSFGNGDGTFQAVISSSVLKAPTSGVIGDFNGDGLTEIIAGNSASGANSSFTTINSVPTSVESEGLRSTGEDFKTLFASRRNILTRASAFRMLADVKALDQQIDNNLGAIEKAFNYVFDNMKMIRAVGLSFIEASKEVGSRSISDPEQIAAVLQQKIRSGAKGSLGLLENLENIVAVTLSRSSSQTEQ
jgi:hypothetical protein